MHLVTRRDYALLRAALSETNFPWDSSQANLLAPSVRALAGAGPVTTAEALAHLEREHVLIGVNARRAWRGARVRAHLVHHPETALWYARPGGGPFVALDEPETHDPTEARAEILRRYLAAFGPASRRDIGAWSMMHVPELQRALERLEPLRRFRDDHGRELLDVPRGPLRHPETPAPVRFLPKWDNVLLAFADRTRVLPEQYRKTVIRMNGDVAQTFLVDGFVAGTWLVENRPVVLAPFAALSRSVQREPAVVPEALLKPNDAGLVAAGEGWFVLNARDACWRHREGRGDSLGFQGETQFPQVGIGLVVLGPGEPMAMYHWETDQEDFLVLSGEALLIIEGDERPLRQWDFVHCPAGTKHVIVGAGEGSCTVLAVGAREHHTVILPDGTMDGAADWGAYTVDGAALRHGAGVEEETTDADDAYRFPELVPTRYRDGWLSSR